MLRGSGASVVQKIVVVVVVVVVVVCLVTAGRGAVVVLEICWLGKGGPVVHVGYGRWA